MGTKIKVLVVDDSQLMQRMLKEMLAADPDIEVVGVASDPFDAREKIKALHPDVLTLDVEMPRMDGVTFLRNLMRLHPLPVVMVSSLTERGADVTLQALELGAVDFVTKPKADAERLLVNYAHELVTKVKMAAKVSVNRLEHQFVTSDTRFQNPRPESATPALLMKEIPPKLSADVILSAKPMLPGQFFQQTVVGIGASTGGTEAIREVLTALPAHFPPVVITQHIPVAFSGAFAKRLDSLCSVSVHEAQDGQVILPNHVYVAPGSRHLLVEAVGGELVCRLNDGPAVNRHKPSVDVMFRSLAQVVGPNAVAVLLTGMGDDGARGLKELQMVGAQTIAQDEKSSVVWGMPGEAVKLGAANFVLPLSEVAPKLLELVNNK